MMVTAKSRAAALGMPELPIRNYWFHQRWGGTGAKMLISPQLQNSFYQEVQPPRAASTPACHPHKEPGSGWKGAVQALYRAGHSMQDFLCHGISQHPSVKDSFVAKQMMRYHSQWHRGVSLELKGPTRSCVWVLSTRQVQKSPARCYTQVCTEQPSAGIPGKQSLLSIQDNSAVCTKLTQSGQHLHFRASLVPNKVFQWWRCDKCIHLF